MQLLPEVYLDDKNANITYKFFFVFIIIHIQLELSDLIFYHGELYIWDFTIHCND